METEEFKSSISEIIKRRLTNPLYFHLLIFTCIIHWNFFVTLFFVSEENIFTNTGLLKNDYVQKLLFDPTDKVTVLLSIIFWVLPFILTWLSVWFIPNWFLIPAIKKDEEYETNKIVIKLSQKRLIEQEKVRLEEQTAKKVTAIAKQAIEGKKIKDIDPKIEWVLDFENFRKKGYEFRFEKFLKSYYSGQNAFFQLDPKDISYFDALGLIVINSKIGAVESITEKGKFFSSKIMNPNY
jgi:hypothetical protein